MNKFHYVNFDVLLFGKDCEHYEKGREETQICMFVGIRYVLTIPELKNAEIAAWAAIRHSAIFFGQSYLNET